MSFLSSCMKWKCRHGSKGFLGKIQEFEIPLLSPRPCSDLTLTTILNDLLLCVKIHLTETCKDLKSYKYIQSPELHHYSGLIGSHVLQSCPHISYQAQVCSLADAI